MTHHVIMMSGGAGPFAAAKRVLAGKPNHVTLLFCDTLIEDEDLYRFLDELRKLGVEQTIIDMLDKDYDLERFAGQHPEGVVQEAMRLVFPVAIPEFNNVGR